MMVCPDTRVRDGFARDDFFVCVHEQLMTETAAMATSCCRPPPSERRSPPAASTFLQPPA
jgi:hypothetical protein